MVNTSGTYFENIFRLVLPFANWPDWQIGPTYIVAGFVLELQQEHKILSLMDCFLRATNIPAFSEIPGARACASCVDEFLLCDFSLVSDAVLLTWMPPS